MNSEQPTLQQTVRSYYEQALKDTERRYRDQIEGYIDHMIDVVGPVAMHKMDPETIRLDFDLYIEIISAEGEKLFEDLARKKALDAQLNNDVGTGTGTGTEHHYPVNTNDQERRVLSKYLEMESYVESIQPGFVCDICHTWFPESKGYLSRPKGIDTAEATSLHDQECIDKHHLIVEPDEKDRRPS